MNVTTADILAFMRDIDRAIERADPIIEAIKEHNAEGTRIELEAIDKKASVCTPGLANKLEAHVDMSKLAHDMGDQFMSYDFMRAVGCSVYSTFHGISESSSNVAHLAYLKSKVRNMHKIGAPSAYGIVMTGDLNDEPDMFVTKTAKDNTAEADLSHELFVMLFALNNLRKIVPNFMFGFGGFRCPEAVIDHETGKVESYCNSAVGQMPYILCESVSPSESFGKVAMTCSVSEFYSLLFQHLFSTHIASEMVGYTHYDCHPGNTLVRKVHVDGLGDEFCIAYTDPKSKRTWYVAAKDVLTIIDFGMTAVRYEGVGIGCGNEEFEVYGVTSQPWPLHDAYKLLGFLASQLIKRPTNSPVLEEIRKIMRFFNNTETLETFILDQEKYKTYFSLPKMQGIEHFSILDLIDHIFRVGDIGEVVTDEPLLPVLECTTCYTFAATVEGSYVRNTKPASFFDFYEAAKHLGTTSKVNYDRMVSSFDYTQAAVDFKKLVDDSVAEMNMHIANVVIPTLPAPIRPVSLTNPQLYNQLQSSYTELVSAVSHYEDIRIWLSVGNAVGVLFQDQDMVNFISQNRQQLADTKNELSATIDKFRAVYRSIRPVVASEGWKRYQVKFPWYHVNSGEIIALANRLSDISNIFVEQRLPSTLINSKTGQGSQGRSGVLPERRRVAVRRDRDGQATGLNVVRD
ncbi:Protein kinase [uncultured virus]|nr:Protein kinase [uncultured virus]